MPKQKQELAIPAKSLREAIRVGQAIVDNNGGKPIDRLTLADVLGSSPKSSGFLQLVASSNLYGLTQVDGGKVVLTDLGKSYYYPQSDEERKTSLLTSAKMPGTLGPLYEHFNKNPLPAVGIAKNILVRSHKIPNNKTETLWQLFLDDAQFIGVIHEIKGKQYLNLELLGSAAVRSPALTTEQEEESTHIDVSTVLPPTPSVTPQELKVFISHGKNTKILEQIKTTVEYGGFKPVIATQKESTAIPVPEKVMNDMHACMAGIINVSADEVVKTEKGAEEFKINENVLIEIGTAFVLYKKKVILVVDRRVKLPSNLQGLYICKYEGDSLDWESGMRLQQALLEFKK